MRLNREPSRRAFQPIAVGIDPGSKRNQSKKKLPPSTRARGPRKLRLAAWLCQLFPVSFFVVEDIKATTRGKRRWDQSFSPLEVGKRKPYGGTLSLGIKRPTSRIAG